MTFSLLLCGMILNQEPVQYREPELTPADRQHWSFQPLRKQTIPTLVQNPVDSWIQAKLNEMKLSFSPQADRRTLIRRVTYDLIGLPPTMEEVQQFIADTSKDAYEKLVDRLLASPHFGERQAQHWLDLVRFAESNGYELDADRPNAWRFRDYVIRSFNADKPYDQFVKEQIAGDEMAIGKDAKSLPDLFIATGFHRCGPVHVVSGNLDTKVVRQEVLTEMVTGVSSVFLGLTLGCARCHDHKFDPLSQADYYRLEAFFAGTQFRSYELSSDLEQKKIQEAISKIKKQIEPLRKKIADIDSPIRTKIRNQKIETLDSQTKEALKIPTENRTAEQKKLVKEAEGILTVRWDEILEAMPAELKKNRTQLREQIYRLERTLPADSAKAWAIGEDKIKPNTFVLKRGDVKREILQVECNTPRIVSADGTQPKSRLYLANWITRIDHPLTARVIMNRLWQQHFGRGIVGTPNDFGTRGDRPTHPELLDWLAQELMKPSDKSVPWSLKRMHRIFVTSQTYRQSSEASSNTPGMAIDPENRLLWHMNRRRLDAEQIRDGMLASAGVINRKMGGPSVKVPLEPEVYDLIFTEDEPDFLWRVTEDSNEHLRRSIYLYAKRNVRYPMLEAFDQPDSINSCSVRGKSTFAPQALIMMNGPFSRKISLLLAQLTKKQQEKGDEKWIEIIFQNCLQRRPSEHEITTTKRFFVDQLKQIKIDHPNWTENEFIEVALADICLAIFNSNEFTYLP